MKKKQKMRGRGSWVNLYLWMVFHTVCQRRRIENDNYSYIN